MCDAALCEILGDSLGSAQRQPVVGGVSAALVGVALDRDVQLGLAGDDFMEGRDGDDDLRGNGGTDTINGGKGTDLCRGENLTKCEQ